MRVVSVTGNFNGDKRGEEGQLSSRGEEGEAGGSPQKAAETEAARESWGGGIGRTGGGQGVRHLTSKNCSGNSMKEEKKRMKCRERDPFVGATSPG